MEVLDLMRARHSVRAYTDQPVPEVIRKKLKEKVSELNKEGKLDMQIFFDEPECFATGKSRYGNFSGVRNYLCVIGSKTADLAEKCGYYGEKFVLFAQSLGLNSCWVGLTHGKSRANIAPGEKEIIVISFGYGENQGVAHKSKPAEKLFSLEVNNTPDWFKKGMEAAMLAPTAVNQQKFLISYDGSKLTAKVNGVGFFAKTDLGIVKCDFELASGHKFDD